MGTGKALPQDFVFGEKSCRQRGPADGQDGNGKSPECGGHGAFQSAHIPHVLFSSHGVDDTP